jgi:cell division protein FtsB
MSDEKKEQKLKCRADEFMHSKLFGTFAVKMNGMSRSENIRDMLIEFAELENARTPRPAGSYGNQLLQRLPRSAEVEALRTAVLDRADEFSKLEAEVERLKAQNDELEAGLFNEGELNRQHLQTIVDFKRKLGVARSSHTYIAKWARKVFILIKDGRKSEAKSIAIVALDRLNQIESEASA